jgi:hypothetical protein
MWRFRPQTFQPRNDLFDLAGFEIDTDLVNSLIGLLRSFAKALDHAVEVEADSLYEAVALAVAEFRQGEMTTELPGPATEFCVMVLRKPIEHRIRLDRVTKWAQPTTREGPAGITKRQRVRTLLGQTG